jgi:phosphoserine phosphatase
MGKCSFVKTIDDSAGSILPDLADEGGLSRLSPVGKIRSIRAALMYNGRLAKSENGEVRLGTRAIILRHGQSSYNSQGRIQGQCDESVLTQKGRADAATTGKAMAGLPLDRVYCSPLQRARTTAEIVMAAADMQPPILPQDLLMEIDLPAWEKRLKEEVKAQFPEDYRIWKEEPARLQMMAADGEVFYPVLSLYDRAKSFWQQVLAEGGDRTILIVAHNGINRALISTALGMAPEYYHTIRQSNCGITVLNFAGGTEDGVQLESLNQTAHLGNNLPTFNEASKGPRFLLVRHGETDWNRAGRFQGQIDVPLNDRGREQSQGAADFLRDVSIDFAYTSPMARPRETAEIILQGRDGVSLSLQPDLQEIAHGLWEGKLESEIEAEFGKELTDWRSKPEIVQMPEGENLKDVWDRSTANWQAILRELGNVNKTGLVVAHDATNKVLLCYLMGLNLPDFWKIKQGNCAVTVVDYQNGIDRPPILQSLNITSHLSGGIFDRTAAGAL